MVDTYNGTLFSLKKEIVTHAATWIDLEDIMLNEINQSKTEQILGLPWWRSG